MSVWRQRFVVLLGLVVAVGSIGNQPLPFPGLAPKKHQLQRLEHQHVLKIWGGGASRAKSTGDGTAGIRSNRDSSSPDNEELDSRAATTHPSERVLILDVDGTLYGHNSGVEQQIVEGIHRYFGQELGLSPSECNEIHRMHGSTVWGLQQERRITEDQVARYYQEVFSSVSVRGLNAGEGDESGDATGYQHRANAWQTIRAHRGPVFVASNSPLAHVRRVLEGVGLGNAHFAGVLTPDTRGWLTKSSPEFYEPILEHVRVMDEGFAPEDVWLLDDSAVNLEVASRLGFTTLLVNGDGDAGVGGEGASDGSLPLERALACFVGAIPHPDEWRFSASKYLQSKNAVDKVSRSKEVWALLEEEVLAMGLGKQDALRVADLGCGLLPLLEQFRSLAKACGAQKLEYCGLEMEESVAKEACEGLLREGYTVCEEDGIGTSWSGDGDESMWRLNISRDQDSGLPETIVCVVRADFTSVDPAALFPRQSDHPRRDTAASESARPVEDRPRGPHVLVGCCLADLLAPTALMRALERLAVGGGGDGVGVCGNGDGGDGYDGCLVYLPITFVGKTRMIPSAPQEGAVPSDEAVLWTYDACLREQQGHFTCLETLLQTIQEHGGDILTVSPSPWRVSFGDDRYMWRCLLYFVGLGLASHRLPLEGDGISSSTSGSSTSAATVTENATIDRDAEASLGRGTGTQELSRGADFPGWVRRARKEVPMFEADNVDLLFRLRLRGGAARGGGGGGRWGGRGWGDGSVGGGVEDRVNSAANRQGQPKATTFGSGLTTSGSYFRGGGREGASPEAGDESASTPCGEPTAAAAVGAAVRNSEFLEFVAPGKVEVRHAELNEEEAVGEGQVLVEAICSSVSSGTELKVFRGDFDSDSELDTSIKGMAGESMSYPLRYGYSLVGRVAKCGAGVDSAKFLGKLVFSFSPHSSWVVADADGVMLVPEGIEPEDAVYLPAVETALSLVHDVHPRVGESVAVFGQGMIGLLAVAILAKTHARVGGGKVVAVDVLSDRLAVAESLGATVTATPDYAAELAPFDISLEVTGNPRGLQSALDLTGYGGRVILGSWYGGGVAQLNLGMAFHRSHLTIQTSQVSRLPAGLTDRWDKDRRFSVAWSLVRELRPSGFLTTSSTRLEMAQGAYESLGAGRELGVVFRY